MSNQGALTDLLGIGGGIINNILMIVGALVLAIGLFFIIKFIQKNSKKQKSFTTTAIIIDMNGVIDFDMIGLVKSEDSGLLEMIFKTRKNDSMPPIPKHLIKNGNVLLLNYAPGHYCVIDPSETINNFSNKISEITLYNLGMKKYITSKHREIINKQEKRKLNFELYAPWITLGVAIISSLILAGVLLFFGAKIEQQNIAERIKECLTAVGR
jgi:hypothetical protein